MNVKDYAQYMLQKHQLAIAIAVIKTKPADITYETYIDSIRNKINERNMDSNLDIAICDDDFNISDDFTQCDDQMMNGDDQMLTGDELNKSHDSVTILRNFDLNDLDDPLKTKDDANNLLDVMTQLDCIEENSAIQVDTSQLNFTQKTNFDETQIPINVLVSNKNEIVDNIGTICETYVESNHKSSNITKVIDNRFQNVTVIDKNNNNATLCHSIKQNDDNSNSTENKTQSNVKHNINIENNCKDSQQTILYTLQGFTDNTHVSQSQEGIIIAKKHLLNKTTTSLNISNQNIKENIQNSKGDLIEGNKDTFVNSMTKNMYSGQGFENYFASNNQLLDRNNASKNKKSTQDYESFDVNKVDLDKDGQRKHKNVESDSQKDNKRVRIEGNDNYYNDMNSSEYAQFSQFSQYQSNISTAASSRINLVKNVEDNLATYSQNNDKNDLNETCNRNKGTAETNSINNYLTQDFALLDRYSNAPEIRLDLNADKVNTIKTNTPDDFEKQFSPLESQSLFLSNLYDDTSLENTLDIHKDSYVDTEFNLTQFEKDIYKNKQSHNLLNENSINMDESNLYQNVRNVANYKVDIENKRKERAPNNSKIESEVILNHLPHEETEKVISNNEIMKECISNENTNYPEKDMSDTERDSQLETVSYKTLEALNIIKCYLNKRERLLSQGINSLDSGFRSSQARSSYKSASQYSDVRINESARCLLNFVTASQLTDKTAEIADQISKMLGKLVDTLHEEEKYPNFLEELLENVNVFLHDVNEGNNEEPNTLLKREDTIYRLLLLNRSTHIINYSIEKIIIILEKTLSHIKEDVLELKHIEKTENVCYIFHILEVMLKRVKKSNESSQISVQNTLDDDRLKKSSLTEIWRRKWNMTRNEIIEDNAKKKCVLTKCSEVLNQIIVQAMDGYSLVSFAALQCFNLLQN